MGATLAALYECSTSQTTVATWLHDNVVNAVPGTLTATKAAQILHYFLSFAKAKHTVCGDNCVVVNDFSYPNCTNAFVAACTALTTLPVSSGLCDILTNLTMLGETLLASCACQSLAPAIVQAVLQGYFDAYICAAAVGLFACCSGCGGATILGNQLAAQVSIGQEAHLIAFVNCIQGASYQLDFGEVIRSLLINLILDGKQAIACDVIKHILANEPNATCLLKEVMLSSLELYNNTFEPLASCMYAATTNTSVDQAIACALRDANAASGGTAACYPACTQAVICTTITGYSGDVALKAAIEALCALSYQYQDHVVQTFAIAFDSLGYPQAEREIARLFDASSCSSLLCDILVLMTDQFRNYTVLLDELVSCQSVFETALKCWLDAVVRSSASVTRKADVICSAFQVVQGTLPGCAYADQLYQVALHQVASTLLALLPTDNLFQFLAELANRDIASTCTFPCDVIACIAVHYLTQVYPDTSSTNSILSFLADCGCVGATFLGKQLAFEFTDVAHLLAALDAIDNSSYQLNVGEVVRSLLINLVLDGKSTLACSVVTYILATHPNADCLLSAVMLNALELDNGTFGPLANCLYAATPGDIPRSARIVSCALRDSNAVSDGYALCQLTCGNVICRSPGNQQLLTRSFSPEEAALFTALEDLCGLSYTFHLHVVYTFALTLQALGYPEVELALVRLMAQTSCNDLLCEVFLLMRQLAFELQGVFTALADFPSVFAQSVSCWLNTLCNEYLCEADFVAADYMTTVLRALMEHPAYTQVYQALCPQLNSCVSSALNRFLHNNYEFTPFINLCSASNTCFCRILQTALRSGKKDLATRLYLNATLSQQLCICELNPVVAAPLVIAAIEQQNDAALPGCLCNGNLTALLTEVFLQATNQTTVSLLTQKFAHISCCNLIPDMLTQLVKRSVLPATLCTMLEVLVNNYCCPGIVCPWFVQILQDPLLGKDSASLLLARLIALDCPDIGNMILSQLCCACSDVDMTDVIVETMLKLKSIFLQSSFPTLNCL